MTQGEEASRQQYAGLLSRILAFWIDFVLCVVLMMPVWRWFASGLAGEQSGVFLLGWSKVVLFGWLLLRWLYLSVGWATRSGTLGCRAARVRVLTSSGTNPSFLRGLARSCSLLLSWAVFGLGWLPIVLTPSHLALHDWIAGTVVVKKPASARDT